MAFRKTGFEHLKNSSMGRSASVGDLPASERQSRLAGQNEEQSIKEEGSDRRKSLLVTGRKRLTSYNSFTHPSTMRKDDDGEWRRLAAKNIYAYYGAARELEAVDSAPIIDPGLNSFFRSESQWKEHCLRRRSSRDHLPDYASE